MPSIVPVYWGFPSFILFVLNTSCSCLSYIHIYIYIYIYIYIKDGTDQTMK